MMTFFDATVRARDLTMACWWPPRAYTVDGPNWVGIIGELTALMNNSLTHRDDWAEALETAEVIRALLFRLAYTEMVKRSSSPARTMGKYRS